MISDLTFAVSILLTLLAKATISLIYKGKQSTQNHSLHSSIIEGSKPDRGRQEMYRDHHLPILFEGPLKPLDQTDGLVLQGVHLQGIKPCILFLDLLGWRCGAGLRFLVFWLLGHIAGGCG